MQQPVHAFDLQEDHDLSNLCVCVCAHVFISLFGQFVFKYHTCEDILVLLGHFSWSSQMQRV